MENQKMRLTDFLKDRIVIGDGAMATQLYGMGVPVGVCYEELCLSKPDIVSSVHRSYVDAGALLIETNTFGAHREGLLRYGLEDQLEQINRAAVRIAREAAQVADAYVAGTIGAVTGARRNLAPPIDLKRAYAEQAFALLEEEPDAILLETFLDLGELRTALQVVRKLTDKPIMAQLALLDLSVTRDGEPVAEAFRVLFDEGADIIGLNCRFGPADMQRVLKVVHVPDHAMISVYPNAGLLSMTDGEYTYPSEPDYFAEAALEFRTLGVRIIGGCCGTTPEHVAAMARAVGNLPPLVAPEKKDQLRPRVMSAGATIKNLENSLSDISVPESVHQKVLHTHTVIVELDPPKDLSYDKFMRGAKELQDAGADAVTLADNSLAMTRMSNMALGALMKQQGVEPLLHISCRDRNLIGQQSHLMGLHALGISQILVVTGDPSRFGDLPGATSVFDVSSFDMIRMVKQLNQGISFSGKLLDAPAGFVVGAAFNPHVRHFDKAIKRLERKVEAGADFIMTQPIYDPAFFKILRDATKHLSVPLFVGVMPLLSQRNAEFLHNEVPGISLTDEVRQRMACYQGAKAREEGIAIARELLDVAMEHFRGIYLITPLLRYEMTAELSRYVKVKANSVQ